MARIKPSKAEIAARAASGASAAPVTSVLPVQSQKVRIPRKASPYNVFIGARTRELKYKRPDLNHKERFSMAVKEWQAASRQNK